jgi:hypothetical protein
MRRDYHLASYAPIFPAACVCFGKGVHEFDAVYSVELGVFVAFNVEVRGFRIMVES